jgi:SPP1 family predicted phage head-tail adaptor
MAQRLVGIRKVFRGGMPVTQKIINPAKYRYQISIFQAPADASRNSFGERTGTGTLLATVWAEKQDWSGRENTEGGRDTADVTTRFLMRWRSDVFPFMTVVCDTITYDIDAVLDIDGTKKELTLMCRKVT